jgi:plastocyanin
MGVALVAVLAPSAPSSARNLPAVTVIALPGAFAAGFSPPDIVIFQGQLLYFRNLDVPRHNLRHLPDDGLFHSDDLSITNSGLVQGANTLPPGTYKFYCSFHQATMKGKLIVRKKV